MFGEHVVQEMNGDLAALKIYASNDESKLPDYLKKLIIQNQMIVTRNDKPPFKKIEEEPIRLPCFVTWYKYIKAEVSVRVFFYR